MICLFAVLAGTGCRTLKAPSKPSEEWTPPEWEKTSRAPDAVWDSIREQKIDTSKPLALVELIDVALANNPSTRQAWKKAKAEEAVEKQAQSKWYPQAKVSADFAKDRKVASRRVDKLNDINYGPSGEATFMLLDFGGRSALVRKAAQTLLAANFQFNQSIQDLLLNVEKAYYGLHSSQANLEAAESDVEDARAALTAARQRFRVGLVSKLDELQAESNYDDALYSLEEAKGDLKTAEATLAQTLGLPADAGLEIIPPSKEMPTDVTKEDVSRFIEEGLKKKPDIAAARADLRAKEAAVTVAGSDLWPTLNLKGTAGRTWFKYYSDPKGYANDYAYMGQVSVDWDIFDGFYNYARMRQARAEAEAEREKLKQAELGASADVWIKYYAFRTAVQKLTYSKAFLDTAKSSHELAMEGYNVGLKSILDLLEAQSQLSEARSKLIRSEKDLFVAFADLAHATGSLHVRGSGAGADRKK